MKSVLQDWVMELPLRFQGALLVAMRGCDLAPKYGPDGEVLKSPERHLVQWLRWCVMTPADPREVEVPGSFFNWDFPRDLKPSAFGHYPLHFVMHVVHALEIVAYHHRIRNRREQASELYNRFVHSFHLNPESQEQLWARLTEDRIATGTVVS